MNRTPPSGDPDVERPDVRSDSHEHARGHRDDAAKGLAIEWGRGIRSITGFGAGSAERVQQCGGGRARAAAGAARGRVVQATPGTSSETLAGIGRSARSSPPVTITARSSQLKQFEWAGSEPRSPSPSEEVPLAGACPRQASRVSPW